MQGLLELANVPYVGAGVLGSAVGMDKAVMKKLFAADGLPIVPYIALLRPEWDRRPRRADRTRGARARTIRCSSSRPISARASASRRRVRRRSSTAAVALALQFDRKVVIEAGGAERA